MNELNTTCCIVGGGPAGMMLGFLLARAGIEVIVLEKHNDFFRDFRGDTIHPSTFNIMYELGLLDDFLKVPHDEQTEVLGFVNGVKYKIADFSHLPVAHKVMGFMPQWDFLNFLLASSKKYPSFKLIVNAEATGVVKRGNKVTGVRATTKDGELAIHSSLVVAADGRGSAICNSIGFEPVQLGAPMDVLWFRISKKDSDPTLGLINLNADNIFIFINRNTYYQCGYVIKKGTLNELKKEGLDSFYSKLDIILPFAKERMNELKSWDDIKLLSVSVTRLKQWYMDGLLCIGDAAHTMSPIGGVGINGAIQDAVATANILYQSLKNGTLTINDLKKVQQRRSFPAAVIQRMQIIMQNRVITPAIHAKNKKLQAPFFIKMLQYFPRLRRLVARLLGMGIRMEHVRTPDIKNVEY